MNKKQMRLHIKKKLSALEKQSMSSGVIVSRSYYMRFLNGSNLT